MSEHTHGRVGHDARESDGLSRLSARIASLESENAQLRTALDSRVVIEQAKGILSERFGIDLESAFLLLRRSARTSRRELHAISAAVTRSRDTPKDVLVVLDGDG
jgi:AmiR/NasT family two-component response regulator